MKFFPGRFILNSTYIDREATLGRALGVQGKAVVVWVGVCVGGRAGRVHGGPRELEKHTEVTC